MSNTHDLDLALLSVDPQYFPTQRETSFWSSTHVSRTFFGPTSLFSCAEKQCGTKEDARSTFKGHDNGTMSEGESTDSLANDEERTKVGFWRSLKSCITSFGLVSHGYPPLVVTNVFLILFISFTLEQSH